ncbi:hypothetical protein ACFYVL_35635 [Streptomyces sp. NPDC004111]|uniref:hypothetical protein n=1 Tax=Streptomyces sp. NPDC004111 TaxID=3364690 RepID=UPI0036B014B1
MTVLPFPEPADRSPEPLDPLESALLSAWNNAPEAMDAHHDEPSEGSDTDSPWAW